MGCYTSKRVVINESFNLKKENEKEKDKRKSITDASGKKPSKGKGLASDQDREHDDVTPLTPKKAWIFPSEV